MVKVKLLKWKLCNNEIQIGASRISNYEVIKWCLVIVIYEIVVFLKALYKYIDPIHLAKGHVRQVVSMNCT